MASNIEKTHTTPRIAIAGATGRVGTTLTESLAAKAVQLLALTRNPDAANLPDGVKAVAVDFAKPDTLERGLDGVDRLFISQGSSAQQVANEIALIDAAVTAGVGLIVKLSAMGPPSQVHPVDWHMLIEAHLATKDIAYTVLRPGPYFDILRRAGPQVANDAWSGAAGNGLANFIDIRDVADVAHVALLDPTSLTSQRAHHLTGPRALSMPDIADELARQLGRTVVYQQRTPEEHAGAMLKAGMSEAIVKLLLGLDKMFRDSALAETTLTVDQLTGHAPRSLSHWVTENIGLFRK